VTNYDTLTIMILISSLLVSSIAYHLIIGDTFVEQLSSMFGTALFVVLAVVTYAAAFLLFRKFIRPLNKDLISSKSSAPAYFRLTYRLLQITLFLDAAIIGLICVQIVTKATFNVVLTILSMQANSLLAIMIFGYLGYKFLSWYNSNRDLAVLFFGLAFSCIAGGTAIMQFTQTAFFMMEDPLRSEGPNRIAQSPDGKGYYVSYNQKDDPRLPGLFRIIQFPLRIAFVLYWVGVAMLLRKYSKTLGKIKFWALVTLPLATFIVGTVIIFGSIGTQFMRGIVLQSAAILGGILFGLIFLIIARSLKTKEESFPGKGEGLRNRANGISRYLTMSVFGTILFLMTNTPPNHIIDWVHIPYPPFGDIVWSFIGLSAYLYGFGLFLSTIAISQDASLRRSIQKLSIEAAQMLGNLGVAQMQHEIQRRVMKISKEQEETLKDQTGIQQAVPEEEVRQYIDDVMQEVMKLRRS